MFKKVTHLNTDLDVYFFVYYKKVLTGVTLG